MRRQRPPPTAPTAPTVRYFYEGGILLLAAWACLGFAPGSSAYVTRQLSPRRVGATFRVPPTPKHTLVARERSHQTIFTQATSTTISTTETTSTSTMLPRNYRTFDWEYYGKNNPYKINYRVMGEQNTQNKPPILLIHGFGANVNHFRYNMPLLAQEGHRVYAIDLIGFGASDKPTIEYSIELFAQLCRDFVDFINSNDRKDSLNRNESMNSKERMNNIDKNDNQHRKTQPWIFAGNSIGGLVSLQLAQTLLPQGLVKGVILFNCAGGMSGFRYEDVAWYLQPLLYVTQKFILSPQGFGARFFANFRTRQNVEQILKESGVYRNTTNVNDELIELLLAPADDPGAQDVFLRVFGGPPGPTPEGLLPTLHNVPILALWGTADPWTPVDQGMHPGIQFVNYVPDKSLFRLELLPGAGHCPHDEFPDACHERILPWLQALPVDEVEEEVTTVVEEDEIKDSTGDAVVVEEDVAVVTEDKDSTGNVVAERKDGGIDSLPEGEESSEPTEEVFDTSKDGETVPRKSWRRRLRSLFRWRRRRDEVTSTTIPDGKTMAL